MEWVVGRAGETDFFGARLMNTKQSANMPKVLSEARCQLDHWRSQRSNKRTQLHKEFWLKAVTLAKKHGLNKTASALNVKYYSLKKHLDKGCSAKPQPDFVELFPGTMTPSGVECMIEWADNHNATVRMHIKGVSLSELTALAGVFRSGRA